MANNYLQFSVAVDVNPDKIEELKQLDQWLTDWKNQDIEYVDDIQLPSFIKDEEAVLLEFCKQQLVYESVGFATNIYKSEYYVYADEGGEVDLATEWLYVLIRLDLLRPKTGYVVFTWAETCSKPRPDEFAGGAAIISCFGVKFQDNPWEWARNQYKEMCHAA